MTSVEVSAAGVVLALSLVACSSSSDGGVSSGATGGSSRGGSSRGGSSHGGASNSGGRGASDSAGQRATTGGTGNAGATTGGSGTSAGGSTPSAGAGGSNGGASSGSAGHAGSSAQAGTGSDVTGIPTEKALAKLPDVRQEHSVAALNGEIYVIGGYLGTASQVSDSVIAYDPVKDSWRDVQKFPGPLNHGNAGSVGGKIYVAGFYTGGTMSTATTQVFAYDPTGDAWTEKTPLPDNTERAAGCVAIDSGFMYVIGGAHDGKSVDDAARYDPAADSWKTLAPLPERREHCAAGAIGGIIYVAGGRVDGITNFEPKTWAYDPTADAWSEKASLPTPRGGLAGAVLGTRLYVFGGEGNSAVSTGVFPNIDVYEPATDTWATIAHLLVPRHGYGSAVLDDKAYLPGGATHQGAGASNENSVFSLQ